MPAHPLYGFATAGPAYTGLAEVCHALESPTLEKLREKILALPIDQREILIASVSVNREVVPLGLHPDWEAELDRRMQDFCDGKAELISEEDMEKELEEMVDRR